MFTLQFLSGEAGSAFRPGNRMVTLSRILSSTVDAGIVLRNMRGDKTGQNLVVPSGLEDRQHR